MSAWELPKVHIDAMLTAGLAYQQLGPVQWFWPPIREEEGVCERGQPWGPECVRLAQERKRQLTPKTAGHVGAMLLAENRRSVNHRYDEEEIEEPYTFDLLPGRVDPVVVLKAIQCYEYQTCEHPEWESSEAKEFCDALRGRMIHNLPGYDRGPGWPITSPSVFLNGKRLS
jgi:hypothetical protein